MDHHCEHEVTAPLVLTLPTGELFVLSPAEFAATFTQSSLLTTVPERKCSEAINSKEDIAPITFVIRTRNIDVVDGSADSEPLTPASTTDATPTRRNSRRDPSCASCALAIEPLTVEELLAREASFTPPTATRTPQGLGARRPSRADVLMQSMVYNEYGELVHAADAHRNPDPDNLSVTQLLRLINKAYRHEYRERLREIIVLQLDAAEQEFERSLDSKKISKERLSLWEFSELASQLSPRLTEGSGPLVYNGPPRVLEIGCGDGTWCFKVKENHPDWIVEGIDDTDHWRCVRNDMELKDFMMPAKSVAGGHTADDYFSKVHLSQEMPEFTVRNINSLTSHKNPIPSNLYGMVRGWDIFIRVESYKIFLEQVLSILQPDGVVEFIEIDPRPRRKENAEQQLLLRDSHRSGIETRWTNKIADRFKNPGDAELTDINTHGWAARVDVRMKANLRPGDGVPAVHLKSWLEGSGFWDVTQNIVRLPVGGETESGKLLQQFLQYQIALEDAIPKLFDDLPEVTFTDLESGEYHLNLHFVTGRKPKDPRTGDLLADGTRQEMTTLKYDRMALHSSKKNSQWQRFDFDQKLPSAVSTLGSLNILERAPELIHFPRSEESEIFSLLRTNSTGGMLTPWRV